MRNIFQGWAITAHTATSPCNRYCIWLSDFSDYAIPGMEINHLVDGLGVRLRRQLRRELRAEIKRRSLENQAKMMDWDLVGTFDFPNETGGPLSVDIAMMGDKARIGIYAPKVEA